MPSFHARYLAGEHESVWDELLALGPRVRDAEYYDDAVAVARETMQRVRRNCEILIPRLEHLGWQFGYAWVDPWLAKESYEQEIKRAPPPLSHPAGTARLDRIEVQNGPLPLALRAFYEIVGGINFVGTPFDRADWPGIEDGLDPLYIAGVEQAFMEDGTVGEWPREVFIPPDYLDSYFVSEVFIAPDDLHKYFISGATYISIEIPSRDVDVPLFYVPFIPENTQIKDGDVTLVRYLRYALRGGGFLAFPPVRERERVPEADLAYLTAGLEPI